jgi:phage gp46-like protein
VDISLGGDNLPFDLVFENGDFVAETSLKNAVSLSLFCDRRVTSAEIPQGETSRRGWFGDLLADIDGDEIGSRLWLLDRANSTNENAARAVDYARECLEWMIEDGLADTVNVTADAVGNSILLSIELTQGGKATSYQFNLNQGG